MRKLTLQMPVAVAAVSIALMITSCSSGSSSGSPPEADAIASVHAAPSGSVAPLAVPSVQITYEQAGESITVESALRDMGCSSSVRAAVSPDKRTASALLPGVGDDASRLITANVLGDSLVAFRGKGDLTVDEPSGGMQRVSVVGLKGEALVAEVPPGQDLHIGDVDLSGVTPIPATLSLTLDCRVD